VKFSQIKKIGVGINVLGTSEAVAKGAWEFALSKLRANAHFFLIK
jgi:hypothetical protein